MSYRSHQIVSRESGCSNTSACLTGSDLHVTPFILVCESIKVQSVARQCQTSHTEKIVKITSFGFAGVCSCCWRFCRDADIVLSSDIEADIAWHKILLDKRNQAVVSCFTKPKIQIKASQAELSKALATSIHLLA